jgi:hypothetical protein
MVLGRNLGVIINLALGRPRIVVEHLWARSRVASTGSTMLLSSAIPKKYKLLVMNNIKKGNIYQPWAFYSLHSLFLVVFSLSSPVSCHLVILLSLDNPE